MKNILTRIILAVTLVVAAAGSLHAQTTLTSTTLAAAITNASDQTMRITSATGWTASTSSAQTYAVVEREAVAIRTISSTNVAIIRGQFGTRATGHPSGTIVTFIPAGSAALSSYGRSGACSTSGSADPTQDGSVLPIIVPSEGRTYSCQSSKWAFADLTTTGGVLTYPVSSGGIPTLVLDSKFSTGSGTMTQDQTDYTARVTGGIIGLTAGAATLSGITPAFTSSSSGFCFAEDISVASGGTAKAILASTSSVTFSGTGTDRLVYICIGK